MRKLTLLITMLFLSLGMALAQTNANGNALVTFTNVQADGTEYVLYINNDGVLDFSTKSAAELGEAAQFRATKQSNGKWTFYNESKGYYMIWRGYTSGGYNSNAGTLEEYNSTYCDWAVKTGSVDGLFRIVSKRSNGNDGSIVIMRSGRFDAYGDSDGYVGTGNAHSNQFRIDVVDHFGFEAAKDYASINKWYYLNIHNDGYYLSNILVNGKMPLNVTTVPADNKNAYSWAFVGDPFTGYQLVNKAAGKGYILSSSTTMNGNTGAGTNPVMTATPVSEGYNTYWVATVSNDRGENGFYLNQKGYDSNKMNKRDGYLAYWSTGTDGGSTFKVVLRDDAAELKDLIDDAKTLLGDGVGYATIDSKTSVNKAISVAEDAILNNSGYDEAAAGLLGAMNDIKTTQPEAGKYYTIENVKDYAAKKPIYVANDNGLSFSEGYNVSKWFKFVPDNNGNIYLYNVKTGKYLSTNGKQYSGRVKAEATTIEGGAKPVTITNMGLANIVKIVPVGGDMIHAQRDNSVVVAWVNNDVDGASAWTILEVENPGVAYIDNQNYATLADAVDAWQEGKTINLLANTKETVVLPKGMKLDVINFNDFTAPNVSEWVPVAKIGETEYPSLGEAITAASAGSTITFVADINENVTLKKNVTIDGAGKTYTGTMTVNKGLTVTVENVNFVNGGIDKPKAQKSTTGTYTIKNCTFVGEGKYAYPLRFYGAGTLNVENCTVKNYLYSFLYINGSTLNLNINNVTVEDCPNYAVYFATGVTNASIEGLTVKNSNSGILVNNTAARTLTIKNCKMENVTTAIDHANGTSAITANVQGVNNFGAAVLSQYAKCVLAEDATLAATTAGLNITTNVEGKEVAYQDGKYSVVVKRDPAGQVAYRADVTDKEDREGIAILLKDPYAKNSLVVKVYNGETLMFTCTRRDIDDEGKVMFPVTANTTANIVLWGKVSGSWNNEIHVAPTELNVPNRVEIWADGVLVQNYTHESGNILGTNIEKYLALDCVKKFDAKIGNTGYETLAAAVEAAEAGATIVLLRDITASDIITINKAITLDGNGKTLTSTAARAFNIETVGKVVINNLTVNAGERAFNIINKAATVELNDVTATASNNAVMIATSAGAANVTINRCDFTGLAVVNVAGAGAQVAINDTKITNVDANKAENYGAITVSSTATNAEVTVSGGSITVADDSKKAYIFAEGATVTGVDQIGQVVAMIGDAGYETLTEAIADVKEGQTVKMVYNVTLSEILVINKAITLDGNGKTLTSTAGRAFNIETVGKVVINNLTVTAAERAFNIINKAATVELNDVTATASNNAVMIATSAGAANVTINRCDFTGLAVVNVAGAGAQVAINDTKITNVDANKAENYGAITVYSTATDAKVTVNGGSITVADDSKKAYIFAEGAEVTGVDQIGQIVAMIGDAGYETLTKAIADAKEGQTVKMVYDVTLSEILVLDKAITLDGNSKTLTSTAGRAINVDGADGATIKNLTINASGERAINVINGATNVTIDNVTATAANYTVNLAGSAGAAKVAINNSNLTGLNVVNVAAAGSNVTISGGTITCNDQNTNENYAALALNKDAVGGKIAATGVTFDIKGDSKKASNQAEGGTITIDGSTDDVEQHVAYISYGNNWYGFATLEAAIAKAEAGETVKLLRDAKGAGVVINKNLTIDFNGKTYTANAGVGSAGTQTLALQILKGNDVTLKNGTLTSEGENIKMLVQNYANLTVDNMKLVDATDAIQYVLSNNSGDVNVINGSVISSDAVALDACKYANYAKPTVNVAEGVTVNGNVEVSATLNMNGALNGNIVINGAEGVVNGAESLNVTSTVADYELVYADGAYKVVEKFFAAKVGDVKYETLAAAVEAAEAGATVVLLNDVTGAGVVINKNLTIDFKGKTYSFNEGVGSTGTPSNGFQILKGNNVTLKNGTLNVAAEAADKFYILVQNYANLTVENMTLDGKYLDKWVATDGDSYVLSNNSGAVNVIGSTIKANDEGSLAFAMDACLKAPYEAPVVTVADGSTINGNVEVSATLNMNGTLNGNIVINGAEGVVNGAAEGLNVITNVADHKVVNNNGAYTVAAKNYVAQIGEAKYETFAAAVAAAKAGKTITLIADAVEAKTVVLTKNLTIDGAGHTFTGAIEFKYANGSFTVKNVKFNGAGNRVYALKSQAAVTSLTVEDCEVTGYTYGFLYANKAVANAIVNNVTVKDVTYGVHSAYGTNVTLNNFVAEDVEYGVMVQNYGTRKVVLNSCSFTGCETPLYIWERNQTNKITFNFQGANEMGKADFCASENDMAVINADAIVGTKVCGTLAAAVEAAQANETVTLLRNAQLSTFLTIDKSITLNMGECNITRDGGTALYVNGDVEVVINGTTGTVTGSQALWVANGLATVNGGNFCGVAEAVYVTATGKAVIKGGTFSSSNHNSFVLNKKDDSRETASITVYGGTFVGFNPANNAAEGQGTNFVATGLMGVDNGDGTYGIAKANVKVGDSYYATLAEAIAAIGAGDVVIELLADATLDYGAREAYGTAETASVTINGNGNTLTLNQTNSDWSSFGLAAGNVVLNNMTVEKTGYGDTSGAWNTHTIIFSSPVEMNDVTVNNSVAVQAGATLNNVTINEANGYYGLWINGNGQAVTVNGGAINATNGGRGIKIADQYIDAPAQVTLNVTGTKFTTAKKAAVLVSSKAGAQITASNVDITNVAEDKVNFVWVDEDWSPYFAEVEVTGATKAQEGLENLVAQRSNGASYKTLAEAVAAAAAGETITLIGNTEEDVTVSKNLTIEGADMQYTGVMTLNKVNVTVQNLNFVKGQISKSKNNNGGNVTIVNCDFDGQGMDSYAVNVARTGSVVIENVTAQNYGYGFLQLSHANNELSIKDVEVMNTNYALKIDYSNGVTIDGLKVENVKVAAIYNSNYGTKTYTITNSDFSGAAEAIKMWERNTTVYNTFVFAGGNTLGDATLSTSPYAIYKGVVAEVGTKKYLDLRVAFDAAQNGETVKMLEDVTLDTKTLATQNDGYAAIINVAGKAVTLDLNGKNITVNAEAADLASAKSGMLLGVFSTDNGGKLTLVDSEDTATVTLNAVNDAKVYSLLCNYEPGCQIKVEGGTYVADKVIDSMIYSGTDADENQGVTVNGGNFTLDNVGEGANGKPWIFNVLRGNEGNVVVNGGTFNADVNHQFWANEVFVPVTKALKDNGNGTWTVVDAVAYTKELATSTGSSERNVGYATLAEAVASKYGNEITLLANATGAGVVINKDVTIDFNGKTYTFTEGVGSTGTESNGFQILKDNNVTLKNGTLNVAAEAADKFYILVQNYANLTVEDMTLDGTNLDKWSLTDGDSYVFSNNSGNIVVQGNTNITANKDGDKAFAFDADKTANVTVKTTGTIAGKVEKADGATIAISSGTFTEEILPEWCAKYYVPVQNAEGNWTVEYRYTDEMTIVDGEVTEFVNEREITVGKLTYERDFTNFSGWQTLFVPFEIPVEALTKLGYEVAYFYDVHYDVHDEVIDPTKISKVHFIVVKNGTLRANFPYVIKRTSEANPLLSVTLYDAKLYSTAASELNTVESSSTTTRFVFAGTYKKMGSVALTGDDNTPCYRFNPQGQVQKMSATANLVPFRVCMYIKAKDGSPIILDNATAPEYIKMRVIGEENEDGTTTIYDVNAEDGEEMIFDLSGRRVLETEKGGIYIKNGKKVYVK